MKLKNKLLPLVGIGAACAAVTPIALTSCTGNGMVDLVSTYKSNITDIPAVGSYKTDAANALYFESIKSNPNIFADDLYWSRSMDNKIMYSNKNALGGDSLQHAKFDGASQTQATDSHGNTNVDNTALAAASAPTITNSTSNIDENVIKNSIYNVSVDNEKINLSNIVKKTIDIEFTGQRKQSFTVWLATFTEEFETLYDQSSRLIDILSITELGTSNSTRTQKGKIEFVNIPLSIKYSYGSIGRFTTITSAGLGQTINSEIAEGLWNVGLDDSVYTDYSTSTPKQAYLIDYILADEELGARITIDAETSDVSTTTSSTGATTKTNNKKTYKFVMNDELTFSQAHNISSYVNVFEYLRSFGFSHYMWNTSEK